MTLKAAEGAQSPEAVIKRETMISMIINVAFSAGFFLLVFGRTEPIPVWGPGNYAFDLIPQGFMISAMSTLVPGFLAARALRAGRIAPLNRHSVLPRNRLVRALLLGVASSVILGSVGSAALWLLDIRAIAWTPALLSKLAIGAALAAVVTPLALRAELAG